MPAPKNKTIHFRAPGWIVAKLVRIQADRGDDTPSQTLRAMIKLWPTIRPPPVIVEGDE